MEGSLSSICSIRQVRTGILLFCMSCDIHANAAWNALCCRLTQFEFMDRNFMCA